MYTRIASIRLRPDGFSAIELLTVLVVAGVLVSLAGPSMSEYVDRMQTRQALGQLASDVAHARMLAVEQGRRAAVRLHPNGVYTVERLNTDGTWSVLRRVPLQGDYAGIQFIGSTTAIEFTSRGLVTNLAADAYLKVGRGAARDSVFVSPAGRIYRDY